MMASLRLPMRQVEACATAFCGVRDSLGVAGAEEGGADDRSGAKSSLLLAPQAMRVLGDLFMRKNEAIVGRIPRRSLMLMKGQEFGGIVKVAALALVALGLDLAELVDSLLE